ncbi:hypothetical protein BT69DRAFT_1276876 [Atractiella rhizophila]|nr:hypothetical protein BT69DRAFT_1276876 [Atractiella rhizophila]
MGKEKERRNPTNMPQLDSIVKSPSPICHLSGCPVVANQSLSSLHPLPQILLAQSRTTSSQIRLY